MKEYIVAVPEHLASDLFKGDPELIRCKDCTYSNGVGHWCDLDRYVGRDNDYCSSAHERKEE